MAGYLVIAFELRKFDKFNFVHKNLFYFGHWFLPLAAAIVTVLPKVKKSSSKPVTAATEAAAVKDTKKSQ